jgi:flagellar assembly factor FliW
MPVILTKFFGECASDLGARFSFPAGLPGFEDQTSFFFLSMPGSEPLFFLQSVSRVDLCFVLLPVFVVDPAYCLQLTRDDLTLLQLPLDRQPLMGPELLCAAIISFGDGSAGEGEVPTANLLAPIVVNLAANIGMQAILSESGYSHRQPLQLVEAVPAC